MSTSIFLTGVTSLIALIVFFVIAANISRIKSELILINKTLQSTDPVRESNLETARISYYKNKALNKNNEAKEDLITIVYSQLSDKKLTRDARQKLYDDLRQKYEPRFNELGGTYPPFPFTADFNNK